MKLLPSSLRYSAKRVLANINGRLVEPCLNIEGGPQVTIWHGEAVNFADPPDPGSHTPNGIRGRSDHCHWLWRAAQKADPHHVSVFTNCDGRFSLWLARALLPRQSLDILVTTDAAFRSHCERFERFGLAPRATAEAHVWEGHSPLGLPRRASFGRTRMLRICRIQPGEAIAVSRDAVLYVDQEGAWREFDRLAAGGARLIWLRWDRSVMDRPALLDLSARIRTLGYAIDTRLTSDHHLALRRDH